MAERLKFIGFVLMGLWVSLFIYPLVGNWIWGGGWLQNLGRRKSTGIAQMPVVAFNRRMNIRPASHPDLPAILEIYNHAVIHSTATAEYNPQTLDMRLEWYAAHMGDGLPILVAENDGGLVVGWSALSKFHARYGYRFTVEDSVYIAEAWRGRGLGRQLVAPLIVRGRELGLHTIIASIDSENEASLRLHRTLGFEQIAYIREVIYKFDRWLDCVFLQLMLD